MGFIYKITSPSNRIYVGKTKDLRKRMKVHRWAAKAGHDLLLSRSIRKYGWDAHRIDIIEECENQMMDEREIFWICELKTYCYENDMGLNQTRGGDGQTSSWKHNTHRVKKFSEMFSGEGNSFYGRKHTEETKKIMSEKAIARNLKSGKRIPEWGAEKGREIVRKPVVQMDFFGKYISEFISVTEAAEKLELNPSSICAVCKGRRDHTGGFTFSYKNHPDILETKN
jgi:group I intron endonuclease